MRRVRFLPLGIAAVLAAAPLAAQSGGTIELGAFGRWTRFSPALEQNTTLKLPAENGFGGGLRLGFFVFRNLALEADASYTKVDAAGGGKVRVIPLHAGLTYNVPLTGKLAFLIGGRFVHNWYGDDGDLKDKGIGGVAGFRFGPLRVEGTLDYIPKDAPIHGSYSNLGINAGLSLLLGGCNKSGDGVTVSPTTVTLAPGQRTTFSATALRCGKPADVTWSATGGTITEMGEYTAGTTDGSYQVTATEPKGDLSASATVVIRSPPPPPPPVTLARCELTPARARLRPGESVTFTVTGVMSDQTTRAITNATFTATGTPTQAGAQFSWTQPGMYTVTVQCDGMSATAAVEVIVEVILYATTFLFDVDRLTPGGRDSVRVAADEFKKYPDLRIRLEGHADFMGTDAYNCALSWRRVREVQRALNGFGIGNDRLVLIEGFGEAYPVPDAQVTDEMRQRNVEKRDKGKWWDRRVVITSAQKDPGMTACAEPTRR